MPSQSVKIQSRLAKLIYRRTYTRAIKRFTWAMKICLSQQDNRWLSESEMLEDGDVIMSHAVNLIQCQNQHVKPISNLRVLQKLSHIKWSEWDFADAFGGRMKSSRCLLIKTVEFTKFEWIYPQNYSDKGIRGPNRYQSENDDIARPFRDTASNLHSSA